MHNCFKTLLLFSKAYIRQNEFIVMMTKKIENGMIPGAGVLVLGRGQIRRSVNALFFFLQICFSISGHTSDKLSTYM